MTDVRGAGLDARSRVRARDGHPGCAWYAIGMPAVERSASPSRDGLRTPRPRGISAWLRALVVLGVCAFAPSAPGADNACLGPQAARIEVLAKQHKLVVCEAGHPIREYGVRLAKAGVGKTREGDRKLPLGVYPLGTPRKSADYGWFVPIGYPTEAQREQGMTGGDIGIHGTSRGLRWLGHVANWLDTTDGCVGIAADEEMEEILAWLSSHRGADIDIRAEG